MNPSHVCSRVGRFWPGWKAFPAVAVCVWCHTTVLAQTPVQMDDEGGGMLPWAIAAGICVLVCGIAFLNPKRSHHG